jgi:hypothetical protein
MTPNDMLPTLSPMTSGSADARSRPPIDVSGRQLNCLKANRFSANTAAENPRYPPISAGVRLLPTNMSKKYIAKIEPKAASPIGDPAVSNIPRPRIAHGLKSTAPPVIGAPMPMNRGSFVLSTVIVNSFPTNQLRITLMTPTRLVTE